jgi:hypothetical protein
MGFAMCEDAAAFARSFNASDERTLSNGRYVASPLSERRNVRATDNPRFDHRTASVTGPPIDAPARNTVDYGR